MIHLIQHNITDKQMTCQINGYANSWQIQVTIGKQEKKIGIKEKKQQKNLSGAKIKFSYISRNTNIFKPIINFKSYKT